MIISLTPWSITTLLYGPAKDVQSKQKQKHLGVAKLKTNDHWSWVFDDIQLQSSVNSTFRSEDKISHPL